MGINNSSHYRDPTTATIVESPLGEDLSGDLLALISKVGVTLLASATLDETLREVARLVFDAVPAERCLIMLREPPEGGQLRVRAAEARDRRPEVGEVRVSRAIVEEVVNQGRSVLTSDAQHDPRFKSSTVTFQGIRSVLAVLGYELQGISFPSYEIGGDYYDFIMKPNGRLVVAVGDISGKERRPRS